MPDDAAVESMIWTLLFGQGDRGRQLAAKIDTETGSIVERRLFDVVPRPHMAGLSKKCGPLVVAHYCDPVDGRLYIQAGTKRVVVDEETTATHSWARCGFVAQLAVVREDGDELSVRYVSGLRGLIWGREHDALPYPDETEFLFAMAAAINDPERRASALEGWHEPPS